MKLFPFPYMFLIIVITIVILSSIVLSNTADMDVLEAFGMPSSSSCPDILIQKGKSFYLYNSKQAKVPGINPIEFENLEDYTEYIDWKRSQGIRCPVLYLQQSYDAQGKREFKIRPSPDNQMGGLPPSMTGQQSQLFDATHDDPTFNTNLYPGFDPHNQYIGLDTPLDKMFHSDKDGLSDNPMDVNWGGVAYTKASVKSGAYKEDEVSIYIP